MNGTTIYNKTLNFTTKAWWSIVKHQILLISNDNILSDEKVGMTAACKVKLDLNTMIIIAIENRERAFIYQYTLPFPSLMTLWCWNTNVPSILIVNRIFLPRP